MHAPRPPAVISPQRVKNRTSRVASPYSQSLAAWTPPGTALGASKTRGKPIKSPNEGYGNGDGTLGVEGASLWKRALAVKGVGVGTEGSSSPDQSPQGLFSVVMKATQAQRGSGKAITSLNRSAKQYGTKEDMYLELQGLKKAVRLAANERDNLKSRLRRTEEELNRRDKELEEVLSGSGGLSQQELVRSLGDKDRTGQGQGSGSRTLILSLKRQIYTLQKTLREREHALSKLQEDSKTMDVKELQIQLDVCTQEILRLTDINDSYERDITEHFQDQVNLLHANLNKLGLEKNLVEGEKGELIGRLEELQPFLPPNEIIGLGEEKKTIAAKYVGMNYMQLLESISSLEVALITAKHREENTRSKFTVRLEGKEIMLLEMIDKESSLKDEITGLQKEGESLSERNKNLAQECNDITEGKDQFKQGLESSIVEVNELRNRAAEEEKERRELSSVIDSLNDWKRQESLAQEHARRLQLAGSNPFIRHDSKLRRERSARVIQQHWSMHRTKKRQNTFVSDYAWAVGMVQEGFEKYRVDRELIATEEQNSLPELETVPLIAKSDACTQTEELVLINLLQELKEKEELSWAVDTIQQGFEKYSRDKLVLLGEMETEQKEKEGYMIVEEAVQLYRQNEPED